jgi:DNA-nicking Smr family endonuclease
MRVVPVPIGDSFDLHSFLPRDVAAVVSDYLEEAKTAGFREVRLIHGKGIGARRAEVRRLLAKRDDVADFFRRAAGARRLGRDDRHFPAKPETGNQ